MPSISWSQPTTELSRTSEKLNPPKAQSCSQDQKPEYLDPESSPKKTQKSAPAKAPTKERGSSPPTPYLSSDRLMRSMSSTSRPLPSTPIHPTTSGKQLPVASNHNTFDRRKTRSHIKRLQDMYPSPIIPWIDPGIPNSPQPKKQTAQKPHNTTNPPGFLGRKPSIFKKKFDLNIGEPAMEEEFVTSHLERNFDAVKMLWERKDWEENREEVLKEEDIVREKRRKERKERERNDGLSKAQRRRKVRKAAEMGEGEVGKREEGQIDG